MRSSASRAHQQLERLRTGFGVSDFGVARSHYFRLFILKVTSTITCFDERMTRSAKLRVILGFRQERRTVLTEMHPSSFASLRPILFYPTSLPLRQKKTLTQPPLPGFSSRNLLEETTAFEESLRGNSFRDSLRPSDYSADLELLARARMRECAPRGPKCPFQASDRPRCRAYRFSQCAKWGGPPGGGSCQP